MTDSSLIFRHLEIRRAPGFTNGAFSLEELSPGINLIFGPNGVGKTTTADALKMLLWPELARKARAAVAGRLEIESDTWHVDVDISRIQYQREGQESAAPNLPPGDLHDRYSLSLHSLIRADDSQFAARILQEMAGGYDLQRAAEVLQPRSNPPLHRSELGALDAARARLREARANEGSLLAEEARLQDLERERELAKDAKNRIRCVEAAMGLAEARGAEIQAASALEQYPVAMARLKGDEHDSIASARTAQREIQERVRRLEQDLAEARDQLARTGLQPGGLPGPLLPALRADCTKLREAHRSIAELEQVLVRAKAARDSERRNLGDETDDERLARLDSAGVRSLTEFARKAGAVRADRLASDAELRRLVDHDEKADPESLGEGIKSLRAWLRTPDRRATEASRLRKFGTMAGLALLVAGLLMILLYSVSPLLGLTGTGVSILAGFLLWQINQGASADPHDRRSLHEEDYTRLNLPSPDSWSTDAVESLLETLVPRQHDARGNAYNASRRAEILASDVDLISREKEIERKRLDLARLYSVTPDTSADQLLWFIERIGRWQDAQREVTAAEGALANARSRATHFHGNLEVRLAAFGYECIDPDEEVAHLEARNTAHQKAESDLKSSDRLMDQLQEQLKGLDSDCQRIAERLGLTPADEAVIADWCSTYKEFRSAHEHLLKAREAVKIETNRLLATGAEPTLRETPIADLEIELGESEAKAAGLDEINRKITSIETLIRSAKRSHDVEAALAEVARSESALSDLREPAVRSLIGGDLVNYVERATRDRNLPAVFHRARELFSRVTHGRYELSFGNGPEPSFRAVDTRSGRGHSLDELSSGTRVQLLIAVRLAFVEAQEVGLKLPIFLDETLANSDDARAVALIEAVIELALDGRQIFYFTAQADEIGKWQGLLRGGSELPHKVIDLIQVRQMEEVSTAARFEIGEYPIPRVPSPNGDGHAEYGAKLRVPAVDLRAGVGNLHLWYLVEDPQDLYSLLDLGVVCWGDLRNYLEAGGRRRVGPELYHRLEARAGAAEEALQLSSVGRGKHVNRLVLADSGAVSDVFLDRVDDLCSSLGGDGVRLLEALENGDVRRFSAAKIDALRAYLEDNRYIESPDPLTSTEIRLRTLAGAAPDMDAGLVTREQLERLLVRLLAGSRAVSRLHETTGDDPG